RELGFPLVLKTAAGISHKTEHRGVILGIEDEAELLSAYRSIAKRLGERVLVAPMVQQGVEMILGARRDPQFGPVVLLGFGGIHAEVLKDVRFALPPFDSTDARRNTDRLKMRPLLDGARGAPPYDVAAFCKVAAQFSTLVHALRDEVQEIDINPLIVKSDGCIAVDALIVGCGTNQKRQES
ncbi:MAG: acetate--CoA ligase family protein, partial [Woeseiaceae bacterium]